ncbi:type III pantothenate kinase [Thalassotalea sp. M1531]|uniref:Type III pantothenate kinase n=1 Tax=Thalassotalea algicola TaxID=2716224 RepID=A0A7Y0LGN5_9GAMM|nr:type III pantothenate kinase [Thalassotalea algicola]NMP33331.1 type III pantothenate kinase [Thalassotalea algicola]
MQLLIDIGNTRTKYCFVKSGELCEIGYCDNTNISEHWFKTHWQSVNQIILACVANEHLANLIVHWAEANRIPMKRPCTEAEAFGVTNGYKKPTQLGVDRWLAMLGSQKLMPKQACLIVDAGTATTVDYLDRQGMHLGGWILAGVDTLFSSIQLNTENVLGQSADIDSLALGLSTNDNLAQAAWAATLGLITQAINLLEKQLLPIDKVIITGGNGKQLIKLLDISAEYDSKLVFHGLSCFLDNQ